MSEQSSREHELNKRLEGIAWGLFLVLVGVVWLVPFPDVLALEESLFIGSGLIMLGINAARYLSHLPINSFTTFMGAVALLIGLGALAGARVPAIPIILICIGLYLLVRIFVAGMRKTNAVGP